MEHRRNARTLRLAVTADVHLDTSFSWAGPRTGRRLRQGVRDALRRTVERAAALEVDLFMVAGDLFEDGRYSTDTPDFLRGLFGLLSPVPVLLAPGNHDFAGPASPYRTTDWTPNVHVFLEPKLTAFRAVDGFTIWGAGHVLPASTPGFFDSGFRVGDAGVNVALFHGAERGSLFVQEEGKQLHAPFDEAQIAQSGLCHAFVGHYHRPRDTQLLTHPGNPERLSFGETGERALVLADVAPDGSVATRREPVAAVGMYDVAIDATGCRTVDAIRDRLTETLSALPREAPVRVARVTVDGEIPSDLDLTEADLVGVPHDLDALVVHRVRLRPAYDVARIAHESTVRGAFARMVRDAADMDDVERELVLQAGLRALDGRDDLEVV